MIKKILIIKHGSFGDIILATSVFKTIKNNYPKHRIYLLTTSKSKVDRDIVQDLFRQAI